jgi:hypothetical protein
MDPPITYNELLEAVDIAYRGIAHGQTVTTDTWDRILPTLIAAHTLCGGHTRRLVRRVFDATYLSNNEVALALDNLHHTLAAASRTRRTTRGRTRPTPNQLQIFGSGSEATAPDELCVHVYNTSPLLSCRHVGDGGELRFVCGTPSSGPLHYRWARKGTSWGEHDRG